jgi:hypothetical protein
MALADLATPMAVRVAATLRIADHIARGSRTVPALADAVNAHGPSLDRLLRHLTTIGLVCREESGHYLLTAVGEALRSGQPHGMRDRLDITGAVGRADLSFVRLLHAIRTGEPAYTAQYGRPFWEDVAADASLATSFDALMGADVTAEAPAIVAAYDWGALGHVVDVGGGTGALLIALLAAHPTLRGTVVDLPAATDAERTALVDAGVAGRAEVVAGSFFDRLPAGAGGYVLSAILHNWNDGAARTILRRCAEAAGDEGGVFVIEQIGPDGESMDTARDPRMLAYFGGRERSVSELSTLAADAGLKARAVYGAAQNSIVEFRRR